MVGDRVFLRALINKNGKIAGLFFDEDYTRRMSVKEMLSVLMALN